jgi:hypothetical protein
MPLPASMNTRPTSYPPICAFNTIGACPGLGSFLGWSALLNLTSLSDHFKYSVVLVVMLLLDLLVWICSSVLSWILALVRSLQIYILLIPDGLLDAVFGILGLYSFLLGVLLGLRPEHFVALRMFCNPSSGR